MILDVAPYSRPEHNAFLVLILLYLIKDRVIEELMPVYPSLLFIFQHTSYQLHQLIGDLQAARWYLVLKLETHFQELVLAELIFEGEGEINHPIEGYTK